MENGSGGRSPLPPEPETVTALLMYRREIKKIVVLALPIVVGQLGQMLMSVTDTIMVGRLGAQPLAAASIANALFTLVMVVGFGVSVAVTPLTAIARGAGRDSECGVVLRQGLIVNLFFGCLLCAVCLGLAQCIQYMNQPREIVAPAAGYLMVLGISMLPFMLFQNYRQFAEGVNFLKPAMVVTLLANGVNVLANWVFIFGNLGVPQMGVMGAGIATICSRVFMAVVLIWIVMVSPEMKIFDPSLRYRKIDFSMMKKLLSIGIPAGCQYFFEVSAFAASSIMVGWIGTIPLAAHQIALSLASVSFTVAMGISAAGSIQVSHALGRRDLQATRVAGFSTAILCGGFMASAGLVFILFRHLLPGLYISQKEVMDIAATLLIIVAFFQISDGTQAVGLGILRGLTDMKLPTLFTLVAYWGIGLPTGYFLGFSLGWGIYGVWIGLLASLTASGVLMMTRFHLKTRTTRMPA